MVNLVTNKPKFTEAELQQISSDMEEWSPQKILAWCAETYGGKIAMATAFGAEGCALIAMLAQIPNSVYVFNLETGYQFPETLELREKLLEKYGIMVHLVKSDESVEAMEKRFGGPIYDTDPDQCCNIRKIVPLRKVIAGYDAWISAIRRDQSAVRAEASILAWDRKFNLVKVNPLANWSKKDVWNYIVKNDVPYNPLHDRGFSSIGCWPCTRAVNAGEDERAGRWAHSAKIECGLHVQD
jgi:phosphoadenosine phosphosulfate reductase